VPGPTVRATLPPRPDALVRDYVAHVGGDPAAYAGRVPPHLFPQWGFPLAAETLASLPYPLAKTMNAGSRVEVRAPLPAGEPLLVTARLEAVDDDGRRALLRQRVVTGTPSTPAAITADLFAYVPLARARGGERAEKKRPTVPSSAREVGRLRADRAAGLAFASLTGDVNPIHWLPPYARAAGFRRPILHGFATFARAWEGLVRAEAGGDPGRVAFVDARFVKPLPFPADVGLFVDDARGVWVGEAPGGAAYLEGSYGLVGDVAAARVATA
jgi:acyl dehydratase